MIVEASYNEREEEWLTKRPKERKYWIIFPFFSSIIKILAKTVKQIPSTKISE